jgi:hypothetical protein
MFLEAAIALLALLLALLCRPWRMLGSRPAPGGMHDPILSPLITPLLAIVVLLPWVWALPALHQMPLQLRWSGAPLVVLLIGWPLAVPVLLSVGVIAFALAPGLGWKKPGHGGLARSGAGHAGHALGCGSAPLVLAQHFCIHSLRGFWAQFCVCLSRLWSANGQAMCCPMSTKTSRAWPAGSWPGPMA